LPDGTADSAVPLTSTGTANSADTIKQFKQKTVNQHTAVCADLEQELILNGLSPNTAKRLALDTLKAGRDKAYLTAWLTWISAQPNIQNPTAYLIQMIRDNADPPTSTKPVENKLDKITSSLEKYGLYQQPAAPSQSAEERAEATRRRVMEAAYRTQNGETYQ
jgi:hypothetical protein